MVVVAAAAAEEVAAEEVVVGGAAAAGAEVAEEPEAAARHSYHPRRRRLQLHLPPGKEERPGVSATSWRPRELPMPYLTHSLTGHPARAILFQ